MQTTTTDNGIANADFTVERSSNDGYMARWKGQPMCVRSTAAKALGKAREMVALDLAVAAIAARFLRGEIERLQAVAEIDALPTVADVWHARTLFDAACAKVAQ